MSIIEIKMAMESFFDIRFSYVSVIALFILSGIYCFLRMREKKYGYKCSKAKMISAILLTVYLALLIGGMMFNRTPQEDYQLELIPVWSYIRLFREKNLNLLRQMISNVLVFIPWPILFATVFPCMRKFWRAIGSAFLFSVSVEITQLVLRIGLFEFDDMFHNVLGAMIGYYIWVFCRKHKQKGVEE